MGKVFNIVGSYFNKAELIPEGSRVVELIFGEGSDNSYFEGEYYKEGDVKFFAIFQLPEEAGGGYTKPISIPPSECKPTDFNPKEPFTRRASDDYTVEPKGLTFNYTYNGVTVSNTWSINIYPKEFILQSIKIEKQAGFKTEYYDGEVFDNSNMIVKAVGTNGLEKILPYVDPSLAETYGKNCYTYTKDITVNFIEDGNQTVISPDVHEARITLTCYVRIAGSGNGQQIQNVDVSVRVLRDSKKMQFTNINTNQDYINLYFSGTEFVDSGISVFGKYPWDQEEQDLTAKCEFIAKYNNKSISVGSPINYAPGIKTGEVIVKYKDTQNGNKITSSDEYGEKFKINFQVYDISNVIIQPPPEGTKFNVNDKLVDSNNQPIFPMTINYTDATVPPRTGVKDYELLQDSNGIIDGAFKLTKPGTVIIKGRYKTKNRTIESTNNFSIVVERQVKKIQVPKVGTAYYTNPEYNNSVKGYRLNDMPLFKINGNTDSANTSNSIIFKSQVEGMYYFHDWIESVKINNSSFQDSSSRTKLYNYILKSEPKAYTYDITITLKENDDKYTYKWDNSSIIGQELSLQQIQLKRKVNLSINTTSISFNATGEDSFEPSDKTVRVTMSPSPSETGLTISNPIISSSLKDKLDVSGSMDSDYTFTPSGPNSEQGETHSGTVQFKIENANAYENYDYQKTSVSCSVTVNNHYKKPFDWGNEGLITEDFLNMLKEADPADIEESVDNRRRKEIELNGTACPAIIVNYKNSTREVTFLILDTTDNDRSLMYNTKGNPSIYTYLNTQSSCYWADINANKLQSDIANLAVKKTRRINVGSKGTKSVSWILYPPTLEELGKKPPGGWEADNSNHSTSFGAFSTSNPFLASDLGYDIRNTWFFTFNTSRRTNVSGNNIQDKNIVLWRGDNNHGPGVNQLQLGFNFDGAITNSTGYGLLCVTIKL